MDRHRRRSRLRRSVQEELIKYFCAGVTARAAAEVSGINRNTAILFYHKLREVIFVALAAESHELLAGEIEVDESYFGGHRKGKRGRGAARFLQAECLARNPRRRAPPAASPCWPSGMEPAIGPHVYRSAPAGS